ncbi:MAG: hypothetical protein Cons2KO_32360 [Congregibacter sp.]
MTTDTEPSAADTRPLPRRSSTTTEAQQKADEVAAEAKSAARQAVDSASSEAVGHAEEVKNNAAEEVSNIASALRSATADLRSGSATERGFAQMAESLASVSDSLRDKDLGGLVSDLNAFARRNPSIFLGGAALVGFAASRFAKATTAEAEDTPQGPGPTHEPQNVGFVAHDSQRGPVGVSGGPASEPSLDNSNQGRTLS